MNNSDVKQLLNYYQQQLDSANESISDMKAKKNSDSSTSYSEYNLRYKEGFKDALNMVIPHLTKLLAQSEAIDNCKDVKAKSEG